MINITGLCDNRDIFEVSHLDSVELSTKVPMECVYIVLQLHLQQQQQEL